MVVTPSVGELLRSWRLRRRLTQLDLADAAAIPVKSLGQIETGRAGASREMVTRLGERLDIPLRDRNTLMTAAGYGPAYPDRSLDDPALDMVRDSVMTMLAAQEPAPAMAIDRHWSLIAANRTFHRMVAGVDPLLLRNPVNVLRLWLHPAGLAPRIANLREWRDHMIQRLRHRIDATADPGLSDLLEEIQDYPLPRGATLSWVGKPPELAVLPFRLVTIDGTLSFCSAVTRLDAALDVTLAELTIETFLPLDQETMTILRQMAEAPPATKASQPPHRPAAAE